MFSLKYILYLTVLSNVFLLACGRPDGNIQGTVENSIEGRPEKANTENSKGVGPEKPHGNKQALKKNSKGSGGNKTRVEGSLHETKILENSGLYKFHTNGATWNDAVDICESEGRQLYYPENFKDATDVDRLLHIYETVGFAGTIWIGASNFYSSSSNFKTIDGRPLNEVHHAWDTNFGEPDSFNTEHCVMMWSEYELWNVNCNEELSFVCKKVTKI